MKCTGCRICEMVCSFENSKITNPKKARLRIYRSNEEPLVDFPIACHHCADAPCIKVCPTNAITRTKDGMVVVNKSKCIGCGACVEACPFGAMFMDPDENIAINCILCGACVDACPVKALHVLTPEQIAQERSENYISVLVKSIKGVAD